MLEQALTAQIKALAGVPDYDTTLMTELKTFHGKIVKAYSKMLSAGKDSN